MFKSTFIHRYKVLSSIIAFILFINPVLAAYEDHFYDDQLFDNYPYGDNRFSTNKINNPPGSPKVGEGHETSPSTNNDRMGGACNNVDCSDDEGHKLLFTFFIPEDGYEITFRTKHNDWIALLDGREDSWACPHQGFPAFIRFDPGSAVVLHDSASAISSYYDVDTNFDAGWQEMTALYCNSVGDNGDFFDLLVSLDSSPIDLRHYFSAMSSSSIPEIHVNEGILPFDCSDGIDNDGDWTWGVDDVWSGEYNYDFYNDMSTVSPVSGLDLFSERADMPDFGERNVDCFDRSCNGKSGPIIDGVQGLCNFPDEAAVPQEYLCFDDYDNDFDGLKDIDDPDCSAILNTYDCRPELFTESWYDPLATNGLDACCGDDGAALFFDGFDFDTSRWEFSNGVVFEDSFVKLDFSTIYADIAYSSGDTFIISALVDTIFNEGYVDFYFRSSSTDEFIFGESFDPALIDTTCEVTQDSFGTHIRYYPSDTECEFTLGSLPFTLTAFRVYLAHDGGEVWFDDFSFDTVPPGTESGDLGFVLEPLTSQPYPNTESRFFCSQDDNDGAVSYEGGDWKFWDARSAASAEFAVHKLDSFDFISNTEQWFYCDAHGYGGELAIPVPNYATFIDVTPELEDLCPNIPPDFGLLDALDKDNNVITIGNYVANNDCSATYAMDASEMARFVAGFEYVDADGNPFDATNSPFLGCCVTTTAVNPSEGYSIFARGDSACDFTCYDTSGELVIIDPDDTDQGGTSTGDVDDEIKEGLNPENAYYTTTTANCALFALEEGSSEYEVCSQGQYCVGDDAIFAFTTADDGSTEFCCVRGTCTEPEGLTCAEVALEQDIDIYNIYNPLESSFVCYGEEFTDLEGLEAGETCCIGPYGWDEDLFFVERQVSESFICHQGPADQSLFGECCGDTYCFNAPFAQHHPIRNLVDSGNTFGTGSELHTIASFDKIDEFSSVVDYVRHYTIIYPDSFPHIADARAIDVIALDEVWADWSGFDELTFDIYWDGALIPSTVWIGNRDLLDDSVPPTYIEGIPIDSNALVHDTFRSRFWQRVRLDLSDTITSAGNINFIAFEFVDNPSVPDGDSHIYVDNFVLRSSDADLQNYYCSGPSRLWLEDLTLPVSYDVNDVDPRQRACDAQLSFKWTGTSCCGSMTEKSDPNERSLGEYYADSQLGCWGGVPIIGGTRISDAYEDLGREPYILYEEGTYYGCGQEDESFVDVRGEVMTIVGNDAFSIVGDWYCEVSDDIRLWKPVEDLPRTKILFSKLQDLSLDRDFIVHCDEPGREFDQLLSVFDPSGNALTLTDPTMSETICVMSAYDDGVEEVVVGVPLEVDVQTFIDTNLRAFYPYDTSDQTIDCSQYIDSDGNILPMPDTVPDPTNFFVQCSGSLSGDSDDGVDVDVFYNKPLNIVYFSMEEIGGSGGFFDVIWDWLIDLFGDLFDDDNPVPSINLDLYFDADFRHAYVAKFGEIIVKGVMERTELSEDVYPYEELQYSRQARIDYVNFNNDLSGLKTLVLSNGFDENSVSYCVVDTTQSIYLDVAPGVAFDWRYLTSNLQLKDLAGTPYTGSSEDTACLLHNGQIDGTEACDDTYAQWQEIIVLADGQSLDCSDHDPTWSGTISQCINGVLDTSACAVVSDMQLFVTSQSYTGDFGASPDIICQQAATNAGLESPALARALISTSYQNARDVVADGVDVYLINGEFFGTKEEIFDAFASGQLIAYDEFGSLLGSGYVWTGSDDYGYALDCSPGVYQTCIDWTSSEQSTGGCNSRTGIYGDPFDSNNAHWINDDNTAFRSCDEDHHLYCVVPLIEDVS